MQSLLSDVTIWRLNKVVSRGYSQEWHGPGQIDCTPTCPFFGYNPSCSDCVYWGYACIVHATFEGDPVVVIGDQPVCDKCHRPTTICWDHDCIAHCPENCGTPFCWGECAYKYCPYRCGTLYCHGECRADPNPGGGTGGGGTEDKEEYTVTLTASPTAGGTVSGGGTYESGASVIISAFTYSGYKFFNWTGSSIVSTYSYLFVVNRNMNFTANFRPCYDTNKANPLPSMELAPPVTNGNANIAGATYGNTRNGGTTLHNGIDLAGEVGTPVYAQFGGTINGPRVDTQPNKITVTIDGQEQKQYPSDYTGDKNGAGNRIYVSSTIDGNTVRNGYWHLQAGTPIANNPRTGEPWATGDTINAGEVIGYIGITGNASEDVPHLHLNTQVGGVNSNPATYLNATVSTTTSTITTPCD